jgi:radical SAM protein
MERFAMDYDEKKFKFESAMPEGLMVDFNEAPFIVIWEVTQACDLACIHCRAEAQPHRNPMELTKEEGFRLLEEVKKFGNPLFVITGGDPLKREDIFDFIEHGVKIGLRMAMTPSATPLLTRDNIFKAVEKGLSRMAISLDGVTSASHDRFRQVPGSYQLTMNAVNSAREAKLPIQINTTVTNYNKAEMEEISRLVGSFDAVLWSVFFLVPCGRGEEKDDITADEYEEVLNWLYEKSLVMPYNIKTTAATHYRRVILQRRKAERQRGLSQNYGPEAVDSGLSPPTEKITFQGPGFAMFKDGMHRAPRGVNDGNGFVFISHLGEIYPSGFLPISAGNVRKQSIVDVYRNAPLFKDLRDENKLKGKCGACLEYKKVCGGSRARAYAVHGDYLAEEPKCIYQPVAWRKRTS